MKQRKKLYVRFAILFAAIFSVGCVFMAACGKKDDTKDTEPAHTHSYSVTDSKDATCTEDGYVTYTCECGDTYTETVKSSGHTWDQGTATKAASCTAEGETTYTCSVCGETKTEAVPMTEHTYTAESITWDWTWNEDKGYTDVTATAKCTLCQTETTVDGTITSKPADGIYGDYTATAELGGKTYSDTKTAVDQGGGSGSGEEHTHTYGAPTWTWDEENYSYATATFTCTDESCPDEDGQKTVEVKAESSAIQRTVTTAPTCGTDGSCTYTATVTVSFGEGTYTNTTGTVTIPATGAHTYAEIVESSISWSWAADYSSCTASVTVSCTVCNATTTYTDDNCTIAEDAEKFEASTCTQAGHVVYTATATLNNKQYSAETAEITLPLTDHTYPTAEDAGYFVWPISMEGVEENGTVFLGVMCTVCSQTFETVTATVTGITTQAATADDDGATTYTVSATVDGEEIELTYVVTIPALGYTFTVTTADELKAAAAIDNAIIVLSCDITATVEIKGTITIDLSGHTLTGSGTHTITVGAGGQLTIEDTGETGVVDNISNNCAAVFVEVGGEAKLVGGTYTRSLENTTGGTYYTIVNHGTMTICEDVTVKTEAATTRSMVENGWATPTDNATGATATLTIEGGTFTGGASNLIKNDDYGKLVVEDGEFTGNGVSVILNYGELEISDGTFTQESATNNSLVIWNAEGGVAAPKAEINGGIFTGGEVETLYNGTTGTVTITDGVFEDAGYYALYNAYNATITISGGTFTNAYAVILNYGDIVITGGEFASTGDYDDVYIIWNRQSTADNATEPTIKISGGTFTAKDESDCILVIDDGTAEISGGTFIVTEGEDIQAIQDALTENNTVIIILGCDEVVGVVEITTNVTIDLNGKTLVNDNDEEYGDEEHTITVAEGGNLVIKDSVGGGKVDNISDKCAAVYVEEGGTATLTGGTYTRSLENGGDGKYYTIVNLGTMTITEGVTVKTDAVTGASMIENGGGDATATMTITGGTFESSSNSMIKNDEKGKLVISGGEFTGNGSTTVILNCAELVISGGTFKQTATEDDVSNLVVWNYGENGVLSPTAEISGGTFIGGTTATLYNDATGTLAISGGTFENALYVVVYSEGTLTVTGGNLKSTGVEKKIYVIWATDGTVGISDGTFTAGDPSDYVIVAGGDAVVEIMGGTFTGETGATLLYVYGNGAITVFGGYFATLPEGFISTGYTAEYDETTGLYEVVEASKATVTGLVVADADKSITLDVINGEDQREITVYILLSDGTYTTYTSGLTWTYDGDATIAFDGSGSSVRITATAVGEGKIIVSLDGYSIEIAVSVIDSTEVLPSISIDFGNDTTYSSWLPSTIVDGTNYTTGVLTLVTGDGTSDNASKWAVIEGHLNSGGSSQDSKGRYFIINLEDYVTKYVSISVKMASNGDEERSLLLSTSPTDTSTSSSNTLRYVTSTATDDYQTLDVIVEITEDLNTLYLVCGASINFYTIDIEVVEGPVTPEIQSITLSSGELSMTEGDTKTVTATVTMNLYGTAYNGEYKWELSDNTSESITMTTSGFVATIYGGAAGTATVTFSVGEVVVTCTVSVREKVEGEVTTIVWKMEDYETALTGYDKPSSLTEYFFHEGGSVDTEKNDAILSYFIKDKISFENKAGSYGDYSFSKAMKTGGQPSTSNGRYYKIDLTGFEAGTEVTITVVYSSNSSSDTTTCYIGSDLLNTSTAVGSDDPNYGTQSTGTGTTGYVTFTYTVKGDETDVLYSWGDSSNTIRFYGVILSYVS